MELFEESEEYQAYIKYADRIDFLRNKGTYSPLDAQQRKDEFYYLRQRDYIIRRSKELHMDLATKRFIILGLGLLIIMICWLALLV